MSNVKDGLQRITFAEYRTLALVAENQYEESDKTDRFIARLIDRGWIVLIQGEPSAYKLTEVGQQAYNEHKREWERVRAEMSTSLASFSSLAGANIGRQLTESFRASNWFGESASILERITRNIQLPDEFLSPSIASFAKQLRFYDTLAQTGSLSTILKQLYPAQSVIDAIATLKFPLEDVFSTVGHFSAAGAYISQLNQELFASSAFLSAVNKDLTQSILNSASLCERVIQATPWDGYLGELNSFSKSVADWIIDIKPPSFEIAYELENLVLVGRATHIASVPPAYSLAESEETRANIVEGLNSASYTDCEITARMEQVGSNYRDLWSGIVFAISPRNPGRTKQVVYSARELIQTYIDEFAPSDLVQLQLSKKEPSRRERIKFLIDPGAREETIWVVDHLDSLIASLDATMSAIGHDKGSEDRDSINLRALVGLVANAVILLDNNRRR